MELLNTELQKFELHPAAIMLKEHNYRAFAKTYNTYFFVANEAFPIND